MNVERAPLLRYRCAGCGYGASRRHAPERCPMCGGGAWEEQGWQPFPSLSAEVVAAAHRFADADLPLVREATEVSIFPGVPLS